MTTNKGSGSNLSSHALQPRPYGLLNARAVGISAIQQVKMAFVHLSLVEPVQRSRRMGWNTGRYSALHRSTLQALDCLTYRRYPPGLKLERRRCSEVQVELPT